MKCVHSAANPRQNERLRFSEATWFINDFTCKFVSLSSHPAEVQLEAQFIHKLHTAFSAAESSPGAGVSNQSRNSQPPRNVRYST